MKLYFKNQQWHTHPMPRLFNCYAKVDGKLAQWSGEFKDWMQAMSEVRAAVGVKHSGAVLVVIK